MADQSNDFIRDYQALAQQSWDAWTRQLQQPSGPNPFFAPPPAPVQGSETLERTLAGLKGYFDFMQGAAASGTNTGGDWRQQLQQMFTGSSQPFTQAFSGVDTAGAEGFSRLWQSWWQAAQHAQHGGFGDMTAVAGVTPAFGQNREEQMQQQAMAGAVMEALQASARYQALIQRANVQGVERLQNKLAERAEPGRQIDSLKALYDLWVDAAEEAYAEIALSDEFRDVYGEMVNTQMRVRQLQQHKTEQLCRELGLPTRSEVASLGERLQQMRREVRAAPSTSAWAPADEVAELRRELLAIKRQVATLTGRPAASGLKPPAVRKAPATAKKAAAATSRKSPVGKTRAASKPKVASKPKAAPRPRPRQRK